MSIVLFDNAERKKLYPLSNTAAVGALRCGIFSAKERWERITRQKVYLQTADYLSCLYEPVPAGEHLWIDASFMYNTALAERILSLDHNIALADSKGLVAARKYFETGGFNPSESLQAFDTIYDCDEVKHLEYPWQLFQYNDSMLRTDFGLIADSAKSQPLPANNNYINPEAIFIEEGATVLYSTINASTGPVYIGKNAVVMEGCSIRGPFALCESAVLKMGARIYGATTLGPYCVAAGEIKNAVFQAYSNKGHDGYLGDACIGQWCNLGAGSSNSNIKNSAGPVTMWNEYHKRYMPVGVKCGLVMGDYCRSAINSSFNTGTVTGVCCNIFGEGLLPRFIPDFKWGSSGNKLYQFDTCIAEIANWKKMKGQILTDAEISVLKYIFETL